MKRASIVIAIFFSFIFHNGCQKDQEKVAQLEQETMAAEAADYMPQGSGQTGTRRLDSTLTKPRDYAMSPDKIPEELPSSTGRKAKTEAPILSLATAEAKVTEEMPPVIRTSETTQISKGQYSVQIASVTSKEEAELIAKQFASRGYDASMLEARVKGIAYYRVRIGNFASYAQARKLGNELQDKYSVKFWVAGGGQ